MTIKAALLCLIPLALAGQARVPVVVELFTSEGCSSCPPADRLLAEIARTQPVANAEILVLSEHVDYWNRLGWRDPFSSVAFSQRQNQYADAFRKDGVYTPQMVVDGRAEFNGSSARDAKKAIAEAATHAKAKVMLSRAAGAIIVNIEDVPSKAGADVYLAVTESGLRSNVTAGENSGRMLEHTGVVRELTLLGRTKSGSFSKQAVIPPADAQRKAVVFVQDRRTREIVGAASLN